MSCAALFRRRRLLLLGAPPLLEPPSPLLTLTLPVPVAWRQYTFLSISSTSSCTPRSTFLISFSRWSEPQARACVCSCVLARVGCEVRGVCARGCVWCGTVLVCVACACVHACCFPSFARVCCCQGRRRRLPLTPRHVPAPPVCAPLEPCRPTARPATQGPAAGAAASRPTAVAAPDPPPPDLRCRPTRRHPSRCRPTRITRPRTPDPTAAAVARAGASPEPPSGPPNLPARPPPPAPSTSRPAAPPMALLPPLPVSLVAADAADGPLVQAQRQTGPIYCICIMSVLCM